ncbi:hypothetical protein Hypma_002361 [Hypsizygus marmoreus]|uniref:Alpha-xenorhabdolysin family binary toxin subunit A n=1 Tax=Hypsizygus marmoreus TaxID=39966 RepID=A0A369J5G2_HYPMA|nr:hypothetical protein Hypma_002361 [Hypsizygus marmoreus]
MTVSTDALPAYENELKAVVEKLRLNPPPAEDLANAQRSVADKAADPELRAKILEEIKTLSQTVLQIETDFANIANGIRDIDVKKAIRDKNDKPIAKLPEWTELHRGYTDLLINSQTTATEVKTRALDLVKNMLPVIKDPVPPLEAKKEELQGFIEEMTQFAKKATAKAAGFRVLRQGVANFRINLLKLIADQQKEVKTKLEKIGTEIKRLEDDLDSTSGFFSAAWDALKFSVPAGAGVVLGGGQIAAVAGLTVLAPVTAGVLLAAGLGTLGFGIFRGLSSRNDDRAEKANKIDELKEIKSALEVRQQDLKDINTRVASLESDFKSIVEKLTIMEEIWNMLKTDATDLLVALDGLKNSKSKWFFEQRCATMEQLWGTLAWALDNYALGVAPIMIGRD